MIIGDLINLRALKRIESKQILEWVNNPSLKYWTGTVFPISEIEHEEWFEKKLNEKVNKLFGIEERKSGNLIGVIGLSNTDLFNKSTELFTYIGDEQYCGKGFGTDAIKTLVRFAFEELNLHRISLVVFSYNTRAIASYKKVGFVTEGVLKESLYKGGKYHDKIIMAILNDRGISEGE